MPRCYWNIRESAKSLSHQFHLTMAMCPRHLIKTIKRIKIVKWDSIFKKIRFQKSISFKNAFHLTIFTRLMVFTICPGQITIVKWNFQHNDNLPFAWFSQHPGIVKWICRYCVREETSSFRAQQSVQASLWSYNTALRIVFLGLREHDVARLVEIMRVRFLIEWCGYVHGTKITVVWNEIFP